MPFWESSIFWGIAGIVAGIIVAAFFFYIGKARKSLVYQIDSFRDIGSNLTKIIPELKILFNEKPISMLVSTKITFTNSGNQTITSNDFAENAQLIIKVSKCFLGNETYFQIEKDNQNSKTYIEFLGENLVRVYFDFLKEKESIMVTFYHEGDVDVLGELKSGRMQRKKDTSDIWLFFFLILFLIFFICLVLYWLSSLLFPIESFQRVLSAVMAFVFAVGMIYPLINFVRWLISKISSKFFQKKRRHL